VKTLKKVKTGKEIHEEIETCFDRHCSRSTFVGLKPEEVPAYEKELKELEEQKWIPYEEYRNTIKDMLLHCFKKKR
jgi:hypothetical protein